MSRFNEGWWNCFLSYTDTISFHSNIDNIAIEQMKSAGISLDELNKILNDDFDMTDRTRDILIEYKDFIKNNNND